MEYFLAIDIGASSGRHIVGWQQDGELKLDEVYRFRNGMQRTSDGLVWETASLLAEVKNGLAAAIAKYKTIQSVAIDTWGVDYVLMKGDTDVPPHA